jgi:broad specificity phosphatase PhoE
MHLFLIRHGETVDNVAAIIAGVRDSQLTTHGFQQATRLGRYFHAAGTDFTHVFASPLQRAFMTAEQVVLGQQKSESAAQAVDAAVAPPLSVIPVPELRETDFGLYEGVAIRSFSTEDSRMSTVETSDEMAKRAAVFIESYLMPVLGSQPTPVVAVVSHGRFLQTLWPQILLKINPTKVECDQKLLIESRSIGINTIGAWSNTGYLETVFSPVEDPSPVGLATIPVSNPVKSTATDAKAIALSCFSQQIDTQGGTVKPTRWIATVTAINGSQHLLGFKKNRGVGSAAYDVRQGTLDGFIKRPAT